MQRVSLKRKDIITTPNYKRELFEQFKFPQLCLENLENKENKKGNTNISGRNNIETPATCTNITNRYFLCLHQKLAILMYSNESELLNKDPIFYLKVHSDSNTC